MGTSYKDVVRRLTEYREAKGYTHKQIAEMLEISQSLYTKIENRDKAITNNLLMKMHSIGIDIDYLITGMKTRETKLNDLFLACDFSRRTFFINLVVSYMNEWLKHDEKGLDCKRELEILKYNIDKRKNVEVGTVWSHIRKVHNLTQFQMRDILDVDIKTYRKIEKGISMPTAESLTYLYNELGYYPSLVQDIESNYLLPINHAWDELQEEDKDKLESVIKTNLDYVEKNV